MVAAAAHANLSPSMTRESMRRRSKIKTQGISPVMTRNLFII
jgi:hypothetical protein